MICPNRPLCAVLAAFTCLAVPLPTLARSRRSRAVLWSIRPTVPALTCSQCSPRLAPLAKSAPVPPYVPYPAYRIGTFTGSAPVLDGKRNGGARWLYVGMEMRRSLTWGLNKIDPEPHPPDNNLVTISTPPCTYKEKQPLILTYSSSYLYIYV